MDITLKAARVNAGYTQEKAAEKLGVTRETIGNWEREKTFPNAAKIAKIEQLYQISYKAIIFNSKLRFKSI